MTESYEILLCGSHSSVCKVSSVKLCLFKFMSSIVLNISLSTKNSGS